MEDTLKFTGNFTKLKEMGYKFMKLYARNYKVYNKRLPKSFNIWVWVGKGGYIEVNDWYQNTLNIIKAITIIDWSGVKEMESVFGGKYKRMFVRFNHEHADRGFIITDTSFELEVILSMPKEVREGKVDQSYLKVYDEAYAKAYEYYDREVRITEESAKELLEELVKINLVMSK